MSYRSKLLIGILLITIVCFIDYQYLTEGIEARRISPLVRQAGHLAVLAAIVPIGYWAWKSHPMQWTKSIWVTSYIIAFIVLLLVGIIQWQTRFFSNEILDRFYDLRIFFTSPLAFIVLYMLTVIAKKRG
ncbi:MAG: hypothetical protein H6551_03905 [Chitinophagales bacterium]|nr:hypothetical protein [Chitinophagaceae bacterium]MCB9064268.1 hypothetical protein [Chitinophagales bacterium]